MIRQIQNLYSNIYDKLWMRNKYGKYVGMYAKNPKRVSLQKRFPLSDSQKKEVDDYYMTYYGSKIPYDCHQNFAVHTGVFRPDYFADFLFVPFFEHFMNVKREYALSISDKSVFPFIAAAANVKMPNSILYNSFGVFRDANHEYLRDELIINKLWNVGFVFVKPTIESGSAKGIFTANFQDGIDVESGKPIEEVISRKKQNYVVQECARCSEDIAKLYDGCVNTFRIMTYRWKDEFYAMPGVFRIGSGGGKVDNAHAGGMFIAIDEDGILRGKAMTEFMTVYEKHPDSGIIFDGYKIKGYPKVVEAALKLHRMLPELGSFAWDFTIDEMGDPLLIEANILNAGFWIIQCAHACAPFGERQPEVLQWIKIMKNLPYSKRSEFAFGNM